MKYLLLFSVSVGLLGCGYSAPDYLEHVETPTEQESEHQAEDIVQDKARPEDENVGEQEAVDAEKEASQPMVFSEPPHDKTAPLKAPKAWVEANKNELESIEILMNAALESANPKVQFLALERNIEGFDIVKQVQVTDTACMVVFDFVGERVWRFSPQKEAPDSFFDF